MKLLFHFGLFAAMSAQAPLVFADNKIVRGSPERGHATPNHLKRNSAANSGQRQLSSGSCANMDNICDWKGPNDVKYAVCTSKPSDESPADYDSKCVDASFAVEDGKTKSGKRTIESCGCCSGDEDCVADSFPEPVCDAIEFGCSSSKNGNSPKRSFCYFDASSGEEKFEDCADPYDKIKEKEGDYFINCGECPPPCVQCTGESKPFFYVNAGLLTWEAHKATAEKLGCVMASINSQTEQDAAVLALQEALGELSDISALFLNAGGAFLGASLVSQDSGLYTYDWIDGSGPVTSADDSTPTTPNYANWQPQEEGTDILPTCVCAAKCSGFSGLPKIWCCAKNTDCTKAVDPNAIAQQPTGDGNHVFMAFPGLDGSVETTADWDDWTWGNVAGDYVYWPALYTCCDHSASVTEYDACNVEMEEITRM